MKTKLFFSLTLLVLLSGCQNCFFNQRPTKNEAWTKTLAFAEENLSKKGRLIQQDDGYAYVKVDDAYINELFPMLHVEHGFKKPPYFRRKNSPGAHISVIYENEKIKLDEVGQEFSFELKDIRIVKAKNVSYLVLDVEAQELEKLRQKYGLNPKLNGHEFHITLAKRDY